MPRAKIMIVEDEGIVALDIQRKLEDRGYEVPALVSTGEEAVQKAEEIRPDLVLMDIYLRSKTDGIEAASQIRERLDIPVIYLTAYSDEGTLERAKFSAPFGYLLKPFEEKKLYTAVEIALYKHQLDREKANLEAQLHQARKTEAISHLASGIVYHLTNMLQGIQGNLDLALMQAPEELKPYLDAADFDAQQATQLIRQLRRFYQREQADLKLVHLPQLVDEVVSTCRQLFTRKYPQKIELRVQSGPEVPPIWGDTSQLRQCLTALCSYAGDALASLSPAPAPLPCIDIAVETAHLSPPRPSIAGQKKYARIRIADNGPGLDPETQEHLFEPFFAPSSPEREIDLGLAMAYAIVRDHQGWIECESAPGKGTTFALYLPVAEEKEGLAEEKKDGIPESLASDERIYAAEELRGTEKILVIADVDRFRKILAEMLERHGYEVLMGFDLRDGLELFHFEKKKIALVILDLSRPGISGQEILAHLKAEDPEVRVLVVSGYAMTTAPWQEAQAVLNKPFKTHHLLRAVRRLLDRP